MVNYANSIVYKLCCLDPKVEGIYVGSTTSFRKRKGNHKRSCTNPSDKDYHQPVYQYIRDNGDWENWTMITIRRYPHCKDKHQLRAKESKYIIKLKASLNKRLPLRTQKEYYNDNKDEILKKRKQYVEDHREEVRQGLKKYYSENKAVLKEKNKAYQQSKKDEIKEQRKGYYEQNKLKILEERKKYREQNQCEVECSCGIMVKKLYLSTHIKTKKHKRLMDE